MKQSRKQREERIGRQQMQKEKERAQLAEEKVIYHPKTIIS
jgi:hypothetical protein